MFGAVFGCFFRAKKNEQVEEYEMFNMTADDDSYHDVTKPLSHIPDFSVVKEDLSWYEFFACCLPCCDAEDEDESIPLLSMSNK